LRSAVNPLTLPPRLLFRALDDLHAIAEAARRLPAIEAALIERFDRLEDRANAIEQLGEQMLAQGDVLAERAREVTVAGAELAAAFPTLERTAQIGETLAQAVEPLQGAAERLGRVVDRLPGGQRPSRSR